MRSSGGEGEGHGIGRADAEEQAGHEAREGQAAQRSEPHADEGQGHPSSEDQPQDVAAARAQGEAHADLGRVLGHEVRQDAVDPEGRQEQRERREGREQRGSEPALDDLLVEDLVEGPDVRDGLLGVDRRDLRA